MYFTSSHTIIPCFPHNRMQARTLIRLLGYKPAPMIFKLTHFNSLWAWESKKKKAKKKRKEEWDKDERESRTERGHGCLWGSFNTFVCVHLPRSYDTSCLWALPPLARHMQNNNVMSISLKQSQICVRAQDGNKWCKKKSRINKESEHQTCKTQLLKATAHHLQILPRENEKCTNIMIPVNSYRKEIRS